MSTSNKRKNLLLVGGPADGQFISMDRKFACIRVPVSSTPVSVYSDDGVHQDSVTFRDEIYRRRLVRLNIKVMAHSDLPEAKLLTCVTSKIKAMFGSSSLGD